MSTSTRIRRRRRMDPMGIVLAIIPLLAIPVVGLLGYKMLRDRKNQTPPPAPVVVQQPVVETEPEPEPEQARRRPGQDAFLNGGGAIAASPAAGAMDKIADTVGESLALGNKALIVWLFDDSPSAESQRQDVVSQLPRVYEALKNKTKGTGEGADAPLLSVVAAYSDTTRFLTPEPTAKADEVKAAAEGIEASEKTSEMTFTAVKAVTDKFLEHRTAKGRSVFLVLVTDEVGDDEPQVDAAVRPLAQYRIPVYVIGQAASFGRTDGGNSGTEGSAQLPGGSQVRQGPESRDVEWVKLDFGVGSYMMAGMDLGLELGPYCLSRLALESGGQFFALPQSGGGMAMDTGSRSRRGGEGGFWAAHSGAGGGAVSIAGSAGEAGDVKRYAPTYMSEQAYQADIAANKAKKSLIDAAKLPVAEAMGAVASTFPVTMGNEAELTRALQDAQKPVARVRPGIDKLYETLRPGESDAAKLTEPRWKAGYFLALGRVMAAKARADGYIEMCGKMTSGAKFEKEGSNTWMLESTNEPTGISTVDRLATKAREYLTKVVQENPGTPWAMAAQQELQAPLGWKWTER